MKNTYHVYIDGNHIDHTGHYGKAVTGTNLNRVKKVILKAREIYDIKRPWTEKDFMFETTKNGRNIYYLANIFKVKEPAPPINGEEEPKVTETPKNMFFQYRKKSSKNITKKK